MGWGQSGHRLVMGVFMGLALGFFASCSSAQTQQAISIEQTDEPAAVASSEPAASAATLSLSPSLGGAAVVPRAGERCEGEREDERGLRCLTIHRGARSTECRYEVTVEGFDEEGRPGVDVEVTVLNVSNDGSFDYRYESRGHRQWPMGKRVIEVESMIGSRYSENASGQGQCPTPNGEMVECERRDAFIIDNPCTTPLLG